jgi:hypothetical protein
MPYVSGNPDYIRAANMGAAVNGPWWNTKHATIVTFVVKWASPAARVIDVAENDNVVAASGTWNIANGGFTAADVGATFTFAGAAEAGNNGDHIILTVTDGNTVTTDNTGLVNETFDGSETMSLQQVDAAGTFGAEGSNDGPVRTATGAEEPSGEVGSVPITVTVDPDDPDTDEGVGEVKLAAPVGYGWVRLTYTPITGGGILDAAAMAKAY